MQYYNGIRHSLHIFHTPYNKKIFSFLSNMGPFPNKICDAVHIYTKGRKNLPVNLLKKNLNTNTLRFIYHIYIHYKNYTCITKINTTIYAVINMAEKMLACTCTSHHRNLLSKI